MAGALTAAAAASLHLSYPSLTQNILVCTKWCEFIQTGFAGRQTDHVISEGQYTFIWPCSGRSRGQNRLQLDSYYGMLAAVHFKTIIIWCCGDVQVRKRHEVPGRPAKTETCSHHSNLCHGAAHKVHWSNAPCSVFLARSIKELNFFQLFFPQNIQQEGRSATGCFQQAVQKWLTFAQD